MLYDHVLPSRIRALGAAGDFNPQAWDAFLRGQRDSLSAAWSRAVTARARLKKVREALGLPFVVDAPGEPGAPGAWNSDYDKNMLELQVMVQLMTTAADEAVESKRALVFNPDTKSFGIELLPTDKLRVALDATGRPVIADAKTGQVVTQFEGSLGLPPLLIGAIVVVVAVAVYAVVEKVCSTTENVAQTKMLETVRTSGAKLIEEGKATPEQVAAMDKALLEGGAALAKAQGEKAEKESQVSSTVRTVAWVGLGIAGIWLVGTLFAGRMSGAPALARNPAENPHPKIRSGYAYRYDGPSNWQRAPNDDWEIVVVTPSELREVYYRGRRNVDGVTVDVWSATDREGHRVSYAQTAFGKNLAAA